MMITRRLVTLVAIAGVIGLSCASTPSTLHRGLIGKREADLPDAYDHGGGMVLMTSERASKKKQFEYGLAIVRLGDEKMVWLSRDRASQETRDVDWEIRAVLDGPQLHPDEQLFYSGCKCRESEGHVVAIGTPASAPLVSVRRAWLVDTQRERFVPLEPGKVTCVYRKVT